MNPKRRDPLIASQALHLVSPAALAAHLTDGAFRRKIPHLEYLNREIVSSVVRDDGRLMVNMGPRHGKSELTTKWTPAWHLALRPELNVGIAAHTFDFAAGWGGKIRDIVRHNWPDLGVQVAHDSQAKYRWHTQQGGGLSAIGVGGTFIGKGFHLIVIDDPIKDGIEALSQTNQDRVWEWYRSSILTRLEPGGSIIVIMQRWHLQDLCGRLQDAQKQGPEAEGYDQWKVVSAPAISEGEGDLFGRPAGTALWPERYSTKQLLRLKQSMGQYWYAAQYQQHPTPLGGDLIKEAWWSYWVPKHLMGQFSPVVVDGIQRPVVELPDDLEMVFQSWDMNFRDSSRAIEEGKEPDDVSGQVWGRKQADLFLLDRISGPFGLEETIHHVREVSIQWPRAKVKLVEYAANGPAVIARLRHEVGGFRPVTPRGSKASRVMGNPQAQQKKEDLGARAISMAVSCQGGNMYLPHPQLKTWVSEYRRNLGMFPRGGKDDTDATSQAWAFAQGPMWQDVDSAHNEALERGGPPPKTAKEEFNRKMWRMVRAEQAQLRGGKAWR